LLGATFGGYTDADKNGHGTATASIAVGNALVTAPGSNAIAVKSFLIEARRTLQMSSLAFNGSLTQRLLREDRVLLIWDFPGHRKPL